MTLDLFISCWGLSSNFMRLFYMPASSLLTSPTFCIALQISLHMIVDAFQGPHLQPQTARPLQVRLSRQKWYNVLPKQATVWKYHEVPVLGAQNRSNPFIAEATAGVILRSDLLISSVHIYYRVWRHIGRVKSCLLCRSVCCCPYRL